MSVQVLCPLFMGLFVFLLLCWSSLYLLDTRQEVGLFGGRKAGTVMSPLRVLAQRLSGAMIRDVFDPIAIHDEPLFSCRIFKFILMKLDKTLLLGDVYLLTVRELELGPG